MVQEQVKNQFKAPEGRYTLRNDKPNACSFHPQRPIRVTFASVQRSDPQQQQQNGPQKLIIYNTSDALAIAHYGNVDKIPHRQILPGNGGHGLVFPTCHDHYPLVESYDLAVGLSSGDVVVGSVKSQLNAGANNVKLLNMLHFNSDHSIDKTRTVDVAFVPGTNANCFIAAHESGKIYMYQTNASLAGGSPTAKSAASSVPKPVVTINVSQAELTSASVSPDGTKIASTTRDGVLYVHNLSTGTLLGGCRSYFGGLTCCAWSYDSHYIATGGEDDLVCIYGLTEQAQVFWGEGHGSWVTRVAFDRWESEQGTSSSPSASESFHGPVTPQSMPGREQTRYRIASVAQDCQLLFWDFVVEEDDYMDEMGPGAFRSQSLGEEPRTHRRTPSSNAVNSLHSIASGSGESGSRLPPEIQAPAKKSQMIISTPVLAQMVHYDPCSDLVFMKEALYTASFCCGLKCWLRPSREGSKSEAARTSQGSPKVFPDSARVSIESTRISSDSPGITSSQRAAERPK